MYFGSNTEGPPGIVHGGAIASIFDVVQVQSAKPRNQGFIIIYYNYFLLALELRNFFFFACIKKPVYPAGREQGERERGSCVPKN